MSTLLTKFSDYTIHSIEYFISQIKDELDYRDIRGLTNGRVEQITVTKQHPLVAIISKKLNTDYNKDPFSSGLLPAISVTPAGGQNAAFTHGQSPITEIIDDDFIDTLKEWRDKTLREIQQEVLITYDQIDEIIGEYNRTDANGMRLQQNEWSRNEEINISIWSDSPDMDILFGDIMDSLLATIQVGFLGDESKIKNFDYTPIKGLTNFNFGKVLFGTEYNLTFLNTYNNYIVFTDDVISGHDFYGTFTTVGEDE